MNGYLKQSTAAQIRTIGPFVDDTDFKTLENGLTIANSDILLKKNGGASAAKNSGGATADTAGGMYHLTWDATDTATVGELFFSVKVAGALVVFGTYVVVEETIYDALYAASAPGYLQSTVAARTLDVSAGGEAGVDWANVGSPTTAVDLSGTTIKTTQKVDVDTIKTNPVVNGGTITFPTTATLASTTNITAGTVTTATNVTTVNGLAANVITATAIQADAITAAKIADGAIDAATFAAGAINAAAIASDAITAAKIADGAIDAATFAAGAINASAIAADAITAAKVAADVSAEIADQVWDEAIAGHAGAGSTGAALSAAGSAGDPWSTALPGAYGAGTAGKIVGDNINATISSRASQASVDTLDDFVDTEVAAIKAKTDNLPSDPADASDIAASFTTVNTKLDTIDDFLDTEVAAIKAKTDNLPASPAAVGSAMTLTSGERDSVADALLDRANAIETGLTVRQAHRLEVAASAGKLSGAATTTVAIRNAVADSKARITATVDADGNRSAVTTDVT